MRSRPRRCVVGALLLTAAVGATAPPVAAVEVGARDLEEACGYAPVSSFSDRPAAGFGDAVDCVAFYRITTGATRTTFAPDRAVTRAQMASLVVRTGSVAGVAAPAPPADVFDDDDGGVHEPSINRLAASGVATGFADGTFRPQAEVTRAQMASFIARELRRLTGAELPPATSDHFPDDDGTTHEDAVNKLAQIGVVAGTDDGSFSPGLPVSRGQVALFLARSLDWATEEKGAALARIDVADPTGAPELLTATTTTAGAVATVAFTFDEAVASSTIVASGFAVVSFDGTRTVATSVTRDFTSGAVIRATFPASVERLASTATVARNAVQDTAGNLTPEGSAPLREVDLLPGTTAAPDLFSVSRLGASTVDFNFDEIAYRVKPTGYHLLLANGAALDSTAATGDGTTSHNVTFPSLTTAQSSQVVRGYVDTATVSDAPQVRPARALDPDVVEGDANAQQAVPVSASGALAGVPDLLEVAVDADHDQVRYTFDEAVQLPAPSSPLRSPSAFRVYDLDGDEVTTGVAAPVVGDNRTVVATFAARKVSVLASGVSVDAAAVTSTATGATNRVDEEGLARTFGAGETAAPDLLRAGRVQQRTSSLPAGSTVRRVVFEFDQRLALFDADAFSVYSPTGARSALAGCAVVGEVRVTCSVDSASDPTLFAAVGNAALAGVRSGAVLDSSGAFASHAGAGLL